MFQRDLPIEQWGVLLLLHKRAMLSEGRRAHNIMKASGASTHDLGVLTNLHVLIARQDGRELDAKAIRDSDDIESIELLASAEGLHWPRANKLNLALFAIPEYANGSATPLFKVTAVAGVDAVVKLADLGQAQILDSAAERVEPARLTTTKHAVMKTYLLRLTRRGQDLVQLA